MISIISVKRSVLRFKSNYDEVDVVEGRRAKVCAVEQDYPRAKDSCSVRRCSRSTEVYLVKSSFDFFYFELLVR